MTMPYWKTLVAAPALHEQLHSGQVVIVDCRFELGNVDAGQHAYQAAHLPGAIYAHLNRDLSGPITANSGRHPLPSINALSDKFGNWGIDRTRQVVAYDADSGAMAASRLWWLLRWLGHERVAVLDGGMEQWLAQGFEVTASTFQPAASTFTPMVNHHWVVDADTLAARAKQADWCVLDARATERYAGEVEPLDPIAGHIAGVRNYPFTRNIGSDARFLPIATLQQQFAGIVGNTSSSKVIAMCGSGVTACHNLLALEAAGLHGAQLYAGSWSEWSKQGRPATAGRNP